MIDLRQLNCSSPKSASLIWCVAWSWSPMASGWGPRRAWSVLPAEGKGPPGWVPAQTCIHTVGPEDAGERRTRGAGGVTRAEGLLPTSFPSASKKVLSVLVGTLGLCPTSSQPMPSLPAPLSPWVLLPPPQLATSSAVRAWPRVLEGRGPHPSCLPHPHALAPRASGPGWSHRTAGRAPF